MSTRGALLARAVCDKARDILRRRRTVGRSVGNSEPRAPRDLALPNVAIHEQLVVRVVEAGRDQSWGDVVTILATTALRISEASGLRVGDVNLVRGWSTSFGRRTQVAAVWLRRRRRNASGERSFIDPLRPTLVWPPRGGTTDARIPTAG
jgi:integrase